jgi:opacity protein-like surface antigen
MSGVRERIRAKKGTVMRRLLAAVGLIASLSNACAGEVDLATLRGSNDLLPGTPTYMRWSGFYFGGQVGYGHSTMDFSEATQSLVAFALRELALENEVHPSTWQVLGKAYPTSGSVGGFFGYNTRFDDLILGMDFNYSRTSFFANATSSPISRVTAAGGNTYLLTITGDASLRVTDVFTARARAGYAVDNWLGYATIGAAVGRADYTRTATAFGQENPATPCDGSADPPCTPFSFTESEAKKGAFIYGWAVGGGIDVLVMPQVFVRAEYEYVSFAPVGQIKAAVGIGRLGLGAKF